MTTTELLVADVLIEAASAGAVLADLSYASLSRVAAHAGRASPVDLAPHPELTAWQAYLLRESPDANLACIWARALNVDIAPSRALWMVEPCHFAIGLERVQLDDPEVLELSAEHADELAQLARPLLAEDGWQLVAATPRRWFIHRAEALDLRGCAIECASAQGVSDYLPRGARRDELAWRRTVNALQMTWHEHAVNLAREERRLAPINGLWLSGNGAPGPIALPYCEVSGAPPFPGGTTAAPEALRNIEITDAACVPMRNEDWYAYRAALARLDSRLAHYLAALSAGAIAALRITLTGRQSVRSFELTRRDLWKFWERGTLVDLLSEKV